MMIKTCQKSIDVLYRVEYPNNDTFRTEWNICYLYVQCDCVSHELISLDAS